MCYPFPPIVPPSLYPYWLPQSAIDAILVCSPSTCPDQDILMPSCSRICVCSHLPLLLDAFVSLLPHFSMSLSQGLFNCICLAYQSALCLLLLLSGSPFSLLLVHSIFPPPAARGRQRGIPGHPGTDFTNCIKRLSGEDVRWVPLMDFQSFIHLSANKVILLSITCQ